MKYKIFCIGFHKTGTTSISEALKLLGYRVTGPNWIEREDIAEAVEALADALIPKFDAFQDNPWPIIYRFLDKNYPKSKFILTVRDTESWISSQVKHFGLTETPMRRWIYGAGCPKGNESIYVERYEKHNEEVMSYFEDRPEDFLIMNMAEGDGWEKLCRFLGRHAPLADFPHANKATDREKTLVKIERLITRIIKRR